MIFVELLDSDADNPFYPKTEEESFDRTGIKDNIGEAFYLGQNNRHAVYVTNIFHG